MATTSSEGALRVAMAALCVNGGFEVTLRLPGQAVSGSDAEQLGLGTPQYQEHPLFPAVWRKTGVSTSLLVCAEAIDPMLEDQATTALALLESAVGVEVSDVLYVINGCEALMAAGQVYAYRLMVQGPAWI